jgi:hypothetical protein
MDSVARPEPSLRGNDNAGVESSEEHLAPGAGLPRRTLSDRLPRPWMFPLLVFAADWIVILASWQFANVHYHTTHGWWWYFWVKDSGFYAGIARHWDAGTTGPGGLLPTTLGFFPVFPALIKLISFVTGGTGTTAHTIVAGLIANVLSGAAASLAVWALAARVRDRWLADRTVLLFCAFPGAMTFGMMYSDPLGVALAAASLLAALNRRWILAGLLAALGTAEHPTLIALVPALGVAALVAVWTRREWRALLAPVLAPLGVIGFVAWIGTRYHDYRFWPKVELQHWGHHIDWGAHIYHTLTWSEPHMDKHPNYFALVILLVVVCVVGIALMLIARVPLVISVFTICVFASLILSSSAGPLPRYLWPMLGIFIGAAATLPRWLYWPVVVVSAAALFIAVGWWPHHPLAPPP